MRKPIVGIAWIATAVAFTVGSCTAEREWAMLFGELCVPALISVVVGTFVPGVQDYLPWGRAYRRWQQSRIAQGVAELEQNVDDEPERIATSGTPYRDAVITRTKKRPSKRHRARQVAIAAVLGSILTIVSTLAVAAFLPHRESLAAVMLLTGAIATVVLSLVAGRDVGRAQARERLRVEAAVRKLEADYEAKRVRVEAEAEVVEEEPSRKIDRRT